MKVLYLDAEGTVSLQWAKTLGVDTSKEIFLHLKPSSLEETYNILHGAIKSSIFDLIVVDSIAAMASNAEIEAAAEDNLMAVSARGNNRGLKVTGALLNLSQKERGSAPAVILVNQLREGMSLYSGSVLPGGLQQRYISYLTVEFRAQNSKNFKVKDTMIARAAAWKLTKNKVNGKLIDGEFLVYVENYGPYSVGDINSFNQVLFYAVKLGLIEKAGMWYTI